MGLYDELFKLVDKKNKIYTKEAVTAPRRADLLPQCGINLSQFDARSTAGIGVNFGVDLLKTADRIILGMYARQQS